jgi:hypothetical protein
MLCLIIEPTVKLTLLDMLTGCQVSCSVSKARTGVHSELLHSPTSITSTRMMALARRRCPGSARRDTQCDSQFESQLTI